MGAFEDQLRENETFESLIRLYADSNAERSKLRDQLQVAQVGNDRFQALSELGDCTITHYLDRESPRLPSGGKDWILGFPDQFGTWMTIGGNHLAALADELRDHGTFRVQR